jgi:hypothetical protein
MPTERTPEALARYQEQRKAYLEWEDHEAEALAKVQRVDLERRQAELSSNPPPMPDVRFTMDEGIMSDAISIYEPTKKSVDQRWGFVIYRVAFDDDAAWLRCLETLRWCVHRNLARNNPRVFEHLAPYLRWTVVEDRALDGASREEVRRHFRAWAREQSGDPDEMDPSLKPSTVRLALSRSPRHRFYVYVDAEAMRSMTAKPFSMCLPDWSVNFDGRLCVVDAWFGTWKANPEPPPPTVEDLEEMMGEDWEQDEDAGQGGEEEDPDQGWMLFQPSCYNALYVALCNRAWEDLFVPPPGTWPQD